MWENCCSFTTKRYIYGGSAMREFFKLSVLVLCHLILEKSVLLGYSLRNKGARFRFILDEKLKEASACDEVKAALSAKISREQIGAEIDLMISGNQPVSPSYDLYM